jgi:hypothetical protein
MIDIYNYTDKLSDVSNNSENEEEISDDLLK